MHDQNIEADPLLTDLMDLVDSVQNSVQQNASCQQGRSPSPPPETKEQIHNGATFPLGEDGPPSTTIPSSISTSALTNIPAGKIFLDICSGVTRPLSMAILDQGHPVL